MLGISDFESTVTSKLQWLRSDSGFTATLSKGKTGPSCPKSHAGGASATLF